MMLNRCPKCSPETGIRVMPPEETLKRVLPLLKKAGMGEPEDITDKDNLGIPVFSVDRQETALGKPKYYNGKGATREQAMASGVMEAIERQKRRFRGTPFHYNSDMTADAVEQYCPLNSFLASKMRIIYDQLGMSVRSYHKVLKMARTIADLNGREMILERDLMTAVSFRLPEYSEDKKMSGREFSKDKKILSASRERRREMVSDPDNAHGYLDDEDLEDPDYEEYEDQDQEKYEGDEEKY